MCKSILRYLALSTISIISHELCTAQITARKITKPTTSVITVKKLSADSVQVFGAPTGKSLIKATSIKAVPNIVGSRFSPYKTGLEIPANNLGNYDDLSLYNVVINGSWSVSYGAIALGPNKGLINYDLKLENGKKYLVKLVYTQNYYGTLNAKCQLNTKNYVDVESTEVNYSLSKTMGAKNDELVFVVAPTVYDNIAKTKFTPGEEAECYLQLSLTNDYIKEAGKKASYDGDYNMNVFKLVVKEVDF